MFTYVCTYFTNLCSQIYLSIINIMYALTPLPVCNRIIVITVWPTGHLIFRVVFVSILTRRFLTTCYVLC